MKVHYTLVAWVMRHRQESEFWVETLALMSVSQYQAETVVCFRHLDFDFQAKDVFWK